MLPLLFEIMGATASHSLCYGVKRIVKQQQRYTGKRIVRESSKGQ